MTKRSSGSAVDIAREIGALSAAMERAGEDRKDMRESFRSLHDSVDALRMDVRALNQTMQATANQVATIGLEKCGERLDKLEGTIFSNDFQTSTTRLERLEATVTSWQRILGSGKNFALKLILAIIASGILQGAVFTGISKIAVRFL